MKATPFQKNFKFHLGPAFTIYMTESTDVKDACFVRAHFVRV